MLSLVSLKGKTPVPAGEEEGELGEYRQKLLMFLETSSYYDPRRLICDFPFDGKCLAWIQKPLQLKVMQKLIFPVHQLSQGNTTCFRPVLLCCTL